MRRKSRDIEHRSRRVRRPSAAAASLNPHQTVKDLRTEFEVGNPSSVFDDEIDEVLKAGIWWRRGADKVAAVDPGSPEVVEQPLGALVPGPPPLVLLRLKAAPPVE
jgi:hypothetical protein